MYVTCKFFNFYTKNVTLRTYLISFTVQDCFLFRFVCIELVSLIWFLQIWVAIHVFGTMINWFTLIKKLMQTSIVIVSGSIINASTVHLNGIWNLIWRYVSKPVLGGHPVLSGHYRIPRGCSLNTGFTVFMFFLDDGHWDRSYLITAIALRRNLRRACLVLGFLRKLSNIPNKLFEITFDDLTNLFHFPPKHNRVQWWIEHK